MPRPVLVRFRPARLPTMRELMRMAVLVLLILAAAGSTQLLPLAHAQDADDAKAPGSRDPDDRSATDRSTAVITDQASAPDRQLAVPAIPTDAGASLMPTYQLSSPSGLPTAPSQLTLPGQDAGQLGGERLEGEDICDDAGPGGGPAVCARPIETRAGEFAGRRQPQLSAEQRLLAQQAATGAVNDAPDAAARRLGGGRSADLSNEDLAIASVVTQGQGGQTAPSSEEETDLPADATDAINAILGVIVNAPQPQ